ncbi:hypothetical protein [Flavobacterium nitrogenifigens]|uniref:Uncharacterized protein n=1 Tax=Flavobacterium nitrogenifigens TaxID=1617283 RepID=A0A521BKA8_9FLAO|nr:hypothetical protein [Flavobacterium nitrogenifigens]KAF2330909.1 hypothetical protein DM397_14060 [Flavobacterium nitrogenifigens]SMO47553.1 hypothetical protein SAMN06265220_1011071 [Flavobacterium nitrogenifigens]
MIYNKENFPKISSERNTAATVAIYMLFGLLCIAMLVLFVGIPLSLQLEYNSRLSNEEMIFNFIYFPLLFWGIWALYKNYLQQKQKKVILISVDQHGVHHYQYDGTVKSVLYKELGRSGESYVNDIDRKVGTKYSPAYIFGFKDGVKVPIHFSTAENGLSYVPKNKYQLIAHFLQGATLFCPHLKISPVVYTSNFINPKTFEFDKKAERIAIFIAFILVIIILVAVDLFLKYTKGFSILF